MATICITGASDGIGLAATRQLLAAGHRVLVHARSAARAEPVLASLPRAEVGEAVLVTGDLARLEDVQGLARQIIDAGPVDVLVHNAGVWLRGEAPVTPDGFEATFAVNVLAPHLLTALVAPQLRERLIWLGSGLAGSGHPDPADLGPRVEAGQAYADSKACDVALAQAWDRRLPPLASAALDPGWVPTKLAPGRAPGDVEEAGRSLAFCCVEADLAAAPYWRGRGPIPVPARLRDPDFCEAIAASCDQLLEPWLA